MASNVPKFKSSYTPKTGYGRVIKDYYETNPTPSVNWVMGSDTEYRQQYGSNYGSEDLEALSREYVLYRDANGLSANYNAALMPWIEQVRAENKAPTVATNPMAPAPIQSAGTPITGLAGGISAPTPAPVVPNSNPATFDPLKNDPFFKQIEKNKLIDNTKLGGGTPATASANANAGAVPTNATVGTNAAPVTESVPAANNGAQSGQTASGAQAITQPVTGTETAQAAQVGDSVSRQIEQNNAAMNAKLEQSGLPAATIEALKAQSGLGEVGKNYQAAVKQAETDYARAQSRFGQNAEYLAQSGLGNSGFSDASDNAAYAAMQGAKGSAGEAALNAQAEGRKTLYQRVSEEETKLKQERETELLSFVSNKGLGGQEAINYLVAGGMDQTRAEELVAAQIDPIRDAAISKAAAAYVEEIRNGTAPELAALNIGDYPPLIVKVAVEKANTIIESEGYKEQQGKLDEKSTAEGLVWYEANKGSYSEDYLKNYLESQRYNYEDVKTKYDEAQADKLEVIFGRLNGGVEADTAGAKSEIQSILGIDDEDWLLYNTQGNIGALIRDKADAVYADNQALRSKVYAESLVYDISSFDELDYEVISDTQKLIDECARKGILEGDNLTKTRNAMADKLVVSGVGFDEYGKVVATKGAGAVNKYTGFNVNGKQFDVTIEEMSAPWGTLWNKLDGGVEVAVVKDSNGNEQLMVNFTDVDGNTHCGMVKKTTGGELYNALVNKYRGVGYRKASGRR